MIRDRNRRAPQFFAADRPAQRGEAGSPIDRDAIDDAQGRIIGERGSDIGIGGGPGLPHVAGDEKKSTMNSDGAPKSRAAIKGGR